MRFHDAGTGLLAALARGRCLIALAATLSGAASPAAAQSADQLFDPTVLHEIRIFVNSRDLQQLRDRITENIVFPADLHWRNSRIRNVGVRARGSASRSASKPGLRIEFDRFVTGQRFLGLRSLVLDNLWQDPSMIKEHVAMAFFNLIGQAAPRESFSRVYINNRYHGVYAIVEDVDETFVERTSGEGGGYLFEYRIGMPFHAEYLGDSIMPYKALLEARTHRLEPDTVLYAPIVDLFRQVNEDDSNWLERVDAFLDLKQFVAHTAIETFLSELDGLLGYWGMNNFYLYRRIGSDRHQVIPWDKDTAFDDIAGGIFLRAEENEIFRRAMSHRELRALYLDTLEKCAEAAATDLWLSRVIARALLVVGAATYADPLKPYGNDEFDAAAAFMMRFASERAPFVLTEVEHVRRSATFGR
jgi:spore coat protein CotH